MNANFCVWICCILSPVVKSCMNDICQSVFKKMFAVLLLSTDSYRCGCSMMLHCCILFTCVFIYDLSGIASSAHEHHRLTRCRTMLLLLFYYLKNTHLVHMCLYLWLKWNRFICSWTPQVDPLQNYVIIIILLFKKHPSCSHVSLFMT